MLCYPLFSCGSRPPSSASGSRWRRSRTSPTSSFLGLQHQSNLEEPDSSPYRACVHAFVRRQLASLPFCAPSRCNCFCWWRLLSPLGPGISNADPDSHTVIEEERSAVKSPTSTVYARRRTTEAQGRRRRRTTTTNNKGSLLGAAWCN